MHEDAWRIHGDTLEPPDYSSKYTEADMQSIIKVYLLLRVQSIIKVYLLLPLIRIRKSKYTLI